MAREYQHVLELLPQIKGMLESGMTQSEVAAKLGLSGKKKDSQPADARTQEGAARRPKATGTKAAKDVAGIQV